MKKNKKEIPHIGMRIIKSAVGVFLCFVIYLLRGRQGTPFYSALAVLWCIQSHNKDTIGNAFQRIFGTLTGAAFGLIFILIKIYVYDLKDGIVHFFVLSVMIVPIIYSTVLLKKKNAAYFSCVVYLSIVVNHLGDADPVLFVIDRSVDTLIGIILGLLLNGIHIHGKMQKDVLFAADLDNAFRRNGDGLDPYSRFYLGSLLEDGIQLVIMTTQTPATYLEVMPEIRPELPVIAMDGAILYDVNENSYPKVYVISAEQADELEEYISAKGFGLFSTVILEDVLLIYYEKLDNPAEKQIYDKLHRSPYRNYLNKPRPRGHAVVYFMLIDKTEKVQRLLNEMTDEGITGLFKVVVYPSDEHKGYSYLKLYNKNASAENMIDHLKAIKGLKKTIKLSDDNSRTDVMYPHDNSSQMIRHMGKMFYWGKV